jgi:hypothetical protein
MSAKDHLIAIFKKAAAFAAGQLDGFGSPPSQLEQAAPGTSLRSGHGAARQEIART